MLNSPPFLLPEGVSSHLRGSREGAAKMEETDDDSVWMEAFKEGATGGGQQEQGSRHSGTLLGLGGGLGHSWLSEPRIA